MGARARWQCSGCGRQLGTRELLPRNVEGLRLVRAIEDVFFSANALTALCPRCDAPNVYAATAHAVMAMQQTTKMLPSANALTALCPRCAANH